MRKALGALLLFSAAACGGGDQSDSGGDRDLKTFDVQESASDSSASVEGRAPGAPPRPPEIAPTAAPGVAFDYRYAFRLPPARIGAVQEQHAAACEKLGPDRCRITGMTYEQDGAEEVSAQLVLRLDPALARRFGREASDVVTRSDGLVTSAQITGEDVGSAIESDQKVQGQLGESLKTVEGQLAQKGRSGTERAELQRQAEELRRSIRAGEQTVGERRKLLATTPMAFRYTAGETDESFGAEVGQALSAFVSGGRIVLIIFLYLLPWLLSALAIVLGLRWVSRRFFGDRERPAEPPVTPPVAD